MRISIIIAVYKDIEALDLIINALRAQHYPDLEIIIAEDNSSAEMAEYVSSIKELDIVHTTQDDTGIRKARSQNNAIIKSTGEYLIFIDGDCIPYTNFINSHAILSEKGCVLSGRRVNLGEKISRKIRGGSLNASSLEKNYLIKSLALLKDGASHTAQGIHIHPNSWLYNNVIAKRRRSNLNILGCNFSCFKSDIVYIDGFDESYGETAVPDDTDLQWRLEAAGLKMKTCKMAANEFHLYHTRQHQIRDVSSMVNKMLRRKETGNYIAEIGLTSHKYPLDTHTNKISPPAIESKNDILDVAVVLVNYNSSLYTIDCINSIRANTSSHISYRIVVVDNASERDDYINLTNMYAEDDSNNLQIIRSKINLGFSGGNMLGVQNSDAKYYFLLNNDCILQNDCISILYEFCESNTNVALCSPQLVDKHNKPQPCIDYFPTLKTKIFGSGILHVTDGPSHIYRRKIYDTPVAVDVISGSQMFVRAEPFYVIGGFDTTFFLYCEEEDLALRLDKLGYKTYLVPKARNYHAGSGSTVRSLLIKKEYYISFLYLYRKHYGYISTLIIKIIIFMRLLRKSFRDKDNYRLAFFVASGAHIKHSIRHLQKIIPPKNTDTRK